MKRLLSLFMVIIFVIIIGSLSWSLYLTRNPQQPYSANLVTVGVIFNGSKQDGGWNESQYNGFEAIKDELGIQFVYVENVTPDAETLKPVLETLIAKHHASIIFGSSYDYGPGILEVAKEHPKVKFFYMGNWKTADNVATCFGRIYQERYLSGIIAGMQTKTNHIGYVAAYPIPEIYRGINAFTLGARSVNPQAVVHVRWSGTWNDGIRETDATNELLDAFPIDVMTQHQNTIYPLQVAQKRHVYVIGYNIDRRDDFSDVFLTAPVWNWGPFFKERIVECLEGRFQAKAYFESPGSVFGIAPLSPLVSPEAAAKLKEAENRFRFDNWDVFYGPIYDQQGVLRVREGENISDQELIKTFDWFVQGVDEVGIRPEAPT